MFWDVSFNSWGALIEWGLPSVEGLPFEVLCWRSFYREAVKFLVWGLCRLELPSEMFTCYLFAICFSYVCLEEGFVINVHIPNLCVFSFSVGWMCQFSEDAFLIKSNMRWILNLAFVFVISGSNVPYLFYDTGLTGIRWEHKVPFLCYCVFYRDNAQCIYCSRYS